MSTFVSLFYLSFNFKRNMSKKINIYFVLPSQYDDERLTSEEMQQAFELCRQNQMIPEWISEENCLTTKFDKKDIVVFEKFEGETFKKVKTRLSVVGPWGVISCLLEGLQIPNNRSPIYNMAMYNLTITASNYTFEQKKKMKKKIEMMGGVFTLSITDTVTHLIANSVRTQKYLVANSKGINIMLDSWVEDVWNCSSKRNVKGTDAEFEKHKTPCFQNLRICCTGFEIKERNTIQKCIEDNGGFYSGKLLTAFTDMLVCKPGIRSEKYDVAKKAKLPCVRMEWVLDSVKKGSALPEDEYVVYMKVSNSTPTKSDAVLNPDFSMMSVISVPENQNDPFKTSVSDTLNASLFNLPTPQSHRSGEQKENQEPDLIAEIDLQAARKAGTFLDGCGILLAGFSPEKREKLCRLLRNAGATRYDTLSDRVTQVLVGDPTSHEVRLLEGRAVLVSTAWIMESIRKGQPVPEDPYIIQTRCQAVAMPAPSSPLSKKGLSLLQNDTSIANEPEASNQAESEPEEHASIQLYRNNKSEEDTLAKLLADAEDINSKFETNRTSATDISDQEKDESWKKNFEGKTYKLIDHNASDTEKMMLIIEDIGGKVVGKNYRGVTDFAVVPSVSGAIHQHAAAEVISSLWLMESHICREYLTPEYYHHPVIIANNARPLEDCVITISGYLGFERTFLTTLIKELGALYQDKLARVEVIEQNLKGTTHLVCNEMQGNKWEAAKRWQMYVVTHTWLLRCAETGQRVPEDNYLGINDNQDEIIPAPVNNKQDLEELRILPPNITTNYKRDLESKNATTSTAEKKSPVKSLAANNIDPPAPLSNKRDNEGNRKSITPPKIPENKKASPVETHAANHISTPVDIENHKKRKSDENPMLILDDGREESLNTYMNELRAQGLYDIPSPLQPVASNTPIQELLSRLRREGKLPNNQNDTPTRNNSEPGGASQGTPIGRYLRGLQERNVLPLSPKQGAGTSDSPIPRPFFDVKTPDTPLGRFLGEDEPSRSTRKHWQRYLNRFPHYPLHERPAAPPRRPSTPWSEVKRQAWSSLFRNKDGDEGECESSSAPVEAISKPPVAVEEVTGSQLEVSNQIGQLRDMLRRRESSGPSRSVLALDGHAASTSSDPVASTTEAKDSQTDTVGWDEPLEDLVFSENTATISKPRKFMMSAVDQANRNKITNIILSLGGEVSDYKFFDSTATHVVCSNTARNEKILGSMAAGLWILHYSYVEKSGEAGRFLSEEDYELGNPKSETNLASFVESSQITKAIHWWHETVRKAGKGAFHGMRALIFAKNTEAVVRLIEAGGGTILRASPPFAHNIDITHCFLDNKLQIDLDEFIPLAEQGVPCLNVLYLSIFLTNRTKVNINEYIIQGLSGYYN